jgi:hypothetical protein
MKRRLISIIIAAALLFSVTACGGDTDSPEGNGGNSTNAGNSGNSTTDPAVTDGSSTPSAPVLNLPLTIVNNTISTQYLIDNDGGFRQWKDTWNATNVNVQEATESNVRSFMRTGTHDFLHTYFFLKNDNSLWARGSNIDGILGDGTGVNRTESVKILDNVANIYEGRVSVEQPPNLPIIVPVMYAVTLDKELYIWGNETYAPEKILDNVVKLSRGVGGKKFFIKGDGTLWTLEETPEKIMDNIADVNYYIGATHGYLVTKGDNSLWDYGWDLEAKEGKKILDNMKSLNTALLEQSSTLFAFKEDDSLWGWGNNSSGQLGDGTNINRDEPVKLSDSAIYAGRMRFIDSDNNLWEWTTDNPIPEKTQTLEDHIVMIFDVPYVGSYYFHASGRVYERYALNIFVHDNVKMPSTVVVE